MIELEKLERRSAPLSERYINVQDLLDWIEDTAPKPGENTPCDLLVEGIDMHCRDIPYMVGGRMYAPDLPWAVPEEKEETFFDDSAYRREE